MKFEKFESTGVELTLKMPYKDDVLLDMAERQLRNMDCVGEIHQQFEFEEGSSNLKVRIFDVKPSEWATHEILKQETQWPRVNGNNVRMVSDERQNWIQVTLETIPR